LNQITTDINSESITSDDGISKDDVLSEFLDITNLLRSQIEIYPNPTNGDIYIEFGDQIGKAIYIKSLEGKILLSTLKCEGITSLSLDSLNSGIYTIEIIVENGLLITEKIIKL
jgi:hypothetical protein